MIINRKYIFYTFSAFLVIVFFINNWIFSRLTIDDAFITWRYGKNLVQHGIWNYNNSIFDLTQSYTNPIFAILSIIPNYFNIDVVLFFKLFSLIFLLCSFHLLYKIIKNYILVGLFFASPLLIIHSFSGLETYVFVIIIFLIFITAYQKNYTILIWLLSISIFVRPECWILVILTPIYFYIDNYTKTSNQLKVSTKYLILIPLLILILFLLLNKFYFGYFLPTSFDVKSRFEINLPNIFRSVKAFAHFLLLIIPVFLLYRLKDKKFFFFIIIFFLLVILQYSRSHLTMNYASRFPFQIVSPIYLVISYLAINEKYLKISKTLVILYFVYSLLYMMRSTQMDVMSNYYPRGLDSHGKIGEFINQNKKIKTFMISDAGIASYKSDKYNIDLFGLGSSYIAHNGIDDQYLDRLSPEVITLRTYVPHAPPRIPQVLNNKYQAKVIKWLNKHNYIECCDIYFTEEYTIKIYSKTNLIGVEKICESSKKNNTITQDTYLLKHIFKPPTTYWHE